MTTTSIVAIRTSLNFLLKSAQKIWKDFEINWQNPLSMYTFFRIKKTRDGSSNDDFKIGLIRLLGEYLSLIEAENKKEEEPVVSSPEMMRIHTPDGTAILFEDDFEEAESFESDGKTVRVFNFKGNTDQE